jgi:hypothetical protein
MLGKFTWHSTIKFRFTLFLSSKATYFEITPAFSSFLSAHKWL